MKPASDNLASNIRRKVAERKQPHERRNARRPVEESEAQSLGRLRVLIVDDSRLDLAQLESFLGKVEIDGMTTVSAHSLTRALEIFESQKVDLCFCDYLLEDGDAEQLFRATRNRGYTTPFVAVTGMEKESALAEKLLHIGFDDVVLKADLAKANLHRIIRNSLLRAQHVNELVERALHDELTGIYNRRGILTRLREEMERARRLHLPISLVFVDADAFKALNDNHGHQTGDMALIHLAQVIGHAKQRSDILGRMGGDEFVLISPGAAKVMVDVLMARIASAVRSRPLEVAGSVIKLTVSLGGATHAPADPDITIEDLLALADSQMYRTKRMGGPARAIERRAQRHT